MDCLQKKACWLGTARRNECFGLVYLEAMRLGRSCLVSSLDVGRGDINSPEVGLTVNPRDYLVLFLPGRRVWRIAFTSASATASVTMTSPTARGSTKRSLPRRFFLSPCMACQTASGSAG